VGPGAREKTKKKERLALTTRRVVGQGNSAVSTLVDAWGGGSDQKKGKLFMQGGRKLSGDECVRIAPSREMDHHAQTGKDSGHAEFGVESRAK